MVNTVPTQSDIRAVCAANKRQVMLGHQKFKLRWTMKKAIAIALVVVGMIGSPLHSSPRMVPVNSQQNDPKTITWTNAGGSYCLAVLTVNNQPAPGGYFYCPYQSTSYNLPDGKASLYLPDSDPGEFGVNLEGLILTTGPNVTTTSNKDGSVATFSRTDTFSGFGWTGSVTQNYMYVTYYGGRNRKLTKVVNLGGSGSITEQ